MAATQEKRRDMKDEELVRRLRTMVVPAASELARARARHRALAGLGQGETSGQDAARWAGNPWLAPGIMMLAVALVTAWFLARQTHAMTENLSEDQKTLQQVALLFPGQVNAVVEVNGKSDLSIAENPVLGADQPVVVIFRRGHDRIRVLSYSGHRFCIDLGRTHSCFEILESPGGGIIIEGDDRAWSTSQHPVIAGYAVQAQSLGEAL
jgi:hypothetical protein